MTITDQVIDQGPFVVTYLESGFGTMVIKTLSKAGLEPYREVNQSISLDEPLELPLMGGTWRFWIVDKFFPYRDDLYIYGAGNSIMRNGDTSGDALIKVEAYLDMRNFKRRGRISTLS